MRRRRWAHGGTSAAHSQRRPSRARSRATSRHHPLPLQRGGHRSPRERLCLRGSRKPFLRHLHSFRGNNRALAAARRSAGMAGRGQPDGASVPYERHGRLGLRHPLQQGRIPEGLHSGHGRAYRADLDSARDGGGGTTNVFDWARRWKTTRIGSRRTMRSPPRPWRRGARRMRGAPAMADHMKSRRRPSARRAQGQLR